MSNMKYWTLILALAAGGSAPIFGCSSDSVSPSGGGGKSDGGAGSSGSAGAGGGAAGAGGGAAGSGGGMAGSGGAGGGFAGSGGTGGSGGGSNQCAGQQVFQDATCNTCATTSCCNEIVACAQGTPCAALMQCIQTNCAQSTDIQTCVQTNCANELQSGLNDYNALGGCLCAGQQGQPDGPCASACNATACGG